MVDVELGKRRRGAAIAVLVAPGGTADEPRLGPGADAFGDGWRDWIEPTGKTGEVRVVPAMPSTAGWLFGVGDRGPADWRAAGAALIRSIQDFDTADTGRRPAAVDVALPPDIVPIELRMFVLGLRLGGYRFRVTADQAAPVRRTVRLCVDSPYEIDLRVALERAVVHGSATALTRDLANMPSNVKTPAWLAATATRAAAGVAGLTVTVRDEKWLAEQGFGGVLAVGGGSASPPRLIELSWRGGTGKAKTPHLVLIGKGVTFDTGGISIKRPDGMHMMRTDMAGAAAVIAALRGIAALNLPIRVTGLAPAAENHVSGSAYRPGDVVRHVDGTTTQVANTDAEGRMLLADALGYAVRELRPDLMVDVATLTGSMKVALGLRTGGFFATTGELAARIMAAGFSTGERWWRMPLLDDHADDVRGDLADVRQTPPGPGGIAAALFLREFTADLPWVHLDIAGPARSDKTYDEVVPGATGFAARTLISVAESLALRRSG
ncbi:MAG TPA: leucyl aminopeptidase family protein [Pseudonocardiaceae bacterium]|jgi:leucyl aminopeptidase|nr:leucyl aminopeptidase family protein [Pseudonocardiaceae bacterium]